MLRKVPVAGFGEVEVFGLTAAFEKTPGAVDAPPPELGAHNAEVFARLGFSPEELAALKARGVI